MIISIAILGIGLFAENTFKSSLLIGIVAVIALFLFDIYTPKIANLPASHEKIKTMRKLNRFSLVFIVLCFSLIGWAPEFDILAHDNTGLFGTAIAILVIAVIGTAAPKIPFNRYMGLRLPWTIRDEETWNIAHKILGYITYPIIALILIGSLFGNPETYIKFSILTWIAIPGIYSAWFYYQKFRKQTH